MNSTCLILVLTPWIALAQAQSYTTFTFDPPGSTFTYVSGMNNAGQIVGSYTDASGAVHNFIRSADGVTYTTIDVPGALPGTTTVDGINNLGQVVGTYKDATRGNGYIRSADGQTFTTLEPIDAFSYLAPRTINDKGGIAGQIAPGSLVAQAFVRSADGQLIKLPDWTYALS